MVLSLFFKSHGRFRRGKIKWMNWVGLKYNEMKYSTRVASPFEFRSSVYPRFKELILLWVRAWMHIIWDSQTHALYKQTRALSQLSTNTGQRLNFTLRIFDIADKFCVAEASSLTERQSAGLFISCVYNTHDSHSIRCFSIGNE